MLPSSERILSCVDRIFLLILLSSEDASSAISSSERMHLLISPEREERGARQSKSSYRESGESAKRSLIPYFFMASTASRVVATSISSAGVRVISRSVARMALLISFIPPKETAPSLKIRSTASATACRRFSISGSDRKGCVSRQSLFASFDAARSASLSSILLNSSFSITLLFIV